MTALLHPFPPSNPTAPSEGSCPLSCLRGRHTSYRGIPRPSFRVAAALLSILLIVTAVYVIRETSAAASLQTAWSTYVPGLPVKVSAPGPQATSQRPRDLSGPSGGQRQARGVGPGHRQDPARRGQGSLPLSVVSTKAGC